MGLSENQSRREFEEWILVDSARNRAGIEGFRYLVTWLEDQAALTLCLALQARIET
jgi:hypothetical protein